MMVPKFEGYSLDNNRLLIFNRGIYVPPNDELRNLILREAHKTSVHGSFESHEDEGRP
jgi:hypothetical protein